MIKEPIFFDRNRVWRVYTGGKLFAGLFNDPAEDGYLPEEWIASAVRAINKDSKNQKEGLSKVRGQEIYFNELLEKDPEALLGKGKSLRILVKALDSAIRLPAQAHPDKAFSKKHFNSSFGKTECWIILDTRPDAKLFFGFKEGVTKEQFEKAIDESLTNKDAMEQLMEVIHPKKGEVYLVPGRTVHAIGKGCLILEIQEPTDFTIQPEHWCGEYQLNAQEMFMGLSREIAVSCFDFCPAPDSKMRPRLLEDREGFTKEALVSEENTDCFIINRYRLNGGAFSPDLSDQYAIYIVTEGEGKIYGEGFDLPLKKGDYFFLPACLMGKCTIEGRLEIIECY